MKIPVLDNGYVELIESWGKGHAGHALNDYEVGIIEAARQSTQGSFRGWETDKKLLEYLYTNKHSTPFEFAGMTIEVRAPIMVFREWHRHRTQSYNEASARYAPLPNENYVPSIERVLSVSTTNKQAGAVKGASIVDKFVAIEWTEALAEFYGVAESLYQRALSAGIPKELARLCLPVGRYSQMRASANLRNWLAFLTLRMDDAAQCEIRMYANAVGNLISLSFPQTWQLYHKGKS